MQAVFAKAVSQVAGSLGGCNIYPVPCEKWGR